MSGAEEPSGHAALGHVRPRSYEELRAVLASGATRLPKRLRQVATFLWQHPDDVALGSISSVAAQVGVQPSTLVRFAQLFGFSGFSELQEIFKDHVKAAWPAGRERRAGAPAQLGGLVAAAHASLARLEAEFDPVRFDSAIEVLTAAESLWIVGSKRAFPLAAYIALTLSQAGLRNGLIDNVGSNALDQIACLGPRDAVLAISFSPYNSITPDLTASANQRGAAVVAITDSTFSPLVRLSRVHLEVVESSHAGISSVAAGFALGMALALALAERRRGA